MADKNLYTREEFELFRKEQARLMAQDQKLAEEALDVLVQADRYNWIPQTNWLGEPVLNLPRTCSRFKKVFLKQGPSLLFR